MDKLFDVVESMVSECKLFQVMIPFAIDDSDFINANVVVVIIIVVKFLHGPGIVG